MFRTLRRWFSNTLAPAATTAKPGRTRLAAESLESRDVASVSQVVHLTMWHDFDGDRFRDSNEMSTGTGTMIGRDTVLTCAHNLYNNDSRRGRLMHATEVVAAAGRDNSYLPYGQAYGHSWTVPAAWTRGDANSDIGVVRLSRPVGDSTGWLGYANASDASLAGVGNGYRIVGYPASPYGNGYTQKVSGGPIAAANSAVIGWNQSYYNSSTLRTARGTSGAGLIATQITLNGRIYSNMIVGVNVRGYESPNLVGAYYGEAIRINSTWFNFIQNAQQNLARPSSNYSANVAATPQLKAAAPPVIAAPVKQLWQPPATKPAAPSKPVVEKVSLTAGGVYAVRHLQDALAKVTDAIGQAKAAVTSAAAWVDDNFAGLCVG